MRAATSQALTGPVAALVSHHHPTRRRVVQSLGAAGFDVRAAGSTAELSADEGAVAALLVDLDVAPELPSVTLVEEARRAFPGVPIFAVAAIDPRRRLLEAFCDGDVDHVLPKRPGAGAAGDGPSDVDLFAAVRRLLDGPESPGVAPYLLAGAPVHAVAVRGSDDKDAALEEVLEFGRRMQLSDEKLRRAEQAAEELLLNALYGAPRGPDGVARHLPLDRRVRVRLDPGETIHLRYGCDVRTLAIAVADPFGSLTRRKVSERLRKVAAGTTSPAPGAAGAGLGLAMTWTVANQLVFAVSPGRLTEATAVLHVGGSNREAQERGSAVHFYRPSPRPRTDPAAA